MLRCAFAECCTSLQQLHQPAGLTSAGGSQAITPTSYTSNIMCHITCRSTAPASRPHLCWRLPCNHVHLIHQLAGGGHTREAEAAFLAIAIGRVCDVHCCALAGAHGGDSQVEACCALRGVCCMW